MEELCDANGCVCLQEPCCSCACLSIHARALCCTAAPGRVCLQEPSQCCICRCVQSTRKILWFVTVCFKTGMLVTVVSIHVRNTETNWSKQKNHFYLFRETKRKTTETDWVRLFTIQAENVFYLFRWHPFRSPHYYPSTLRRGMYDVSYICRQDGDTRQRVIRKSFTVLLKGRITDALPSTLVYGLPN